ncbi:DNA adenine methylase [Mesorhizobium sp. M1182]|uniref:DNA adenine methylase n=1 Tax=Mesorhizobium sp. M1182 TaxID=2957067 RepID=UPI00333DE956
MPGALQEKQLNPIVFGRPELSLIQPISNAIAALPSTRYYGSKRKLLSWIYENIRGLEFQTVLDLFGGTASVSLLLKAMRKTVTYHDGFRFNEDVGRTLLSNMPALTRLDLVNFLARVVPRRGLISELFAGIYYTDEENAWLDGIANQLNETTLPAAEISLLRYLLYQACLKKRPFNLFHRANLHLRTNREIKRSFGNFATWERSFEHHMIQAYDELAIKPSFHKECTILPSRNAEDISNGYDLVYIDPPYISLQERYNHDDYWRRYHFLEGLAQYGEWEKLLDPISNIRLLQQPQWMIEWSRRKTFSDRLYGLIKTHKNSIVVLSYVTNAFPLESEIKRFFEEEFSNVTLHTREHSHALSRSPRRELLFIGHPRT